eukprot:scaffold1403_cov68-Phaeocystis_antarctica.AAC.3
MRNVATPPGNTPPSCNRTLAAEATAANGTTASNAGATKRCMQRSVTDTANCLAKASSKPHEASARVAADAPGQRAQFSDIQGYNHTVARSLSRANG